MYTVFEAEQMWVSSVKFVFISGAWGWTRTCRWVSGTDARRLRGPRTEDRRLRTGGLVVRDIRRNPQNVQRSNANADARISYAENALL